MISKVGIPVSVWGVPLILMVKLTIAPRYSPLTGLGLESKTVSSKSTLPLVPLPLKLKLNTVASAERGIPMPAMNAAPTIVVIKADN
jgi:hypothetical protein